MLETRSGSIYDYPQYYDLLFGADWKAEFKFLEGCFERFATRPVRRVFEPACGTGRLLIKLAQAGYRVAGNDLNPHAVEYCNARLRRAGFPASVTVGDMAAFQVAKPFDAAFNTINTFRHLPNEKSAEAHFQCMADAVAPGGIYLLGLHLTPQGEPECVDETWSARRGQVQIESHMRIIDHDRPGRMERTEVWFDVTTPTQQFRLRDELHFRIYTLPQMQKLLRRATQWQCVETFDFHYDLDTPIKLDAQTEDVVFVLRRR